MHITAGSFGNASVPFSRRQFRERLSNIFADLYSLAATRVSDILQKAMWSDLGMELSCPHIEGYLRWAERAQKKSGLLAELLSGSSSQWVISNSRITR